MRPFGSPLSSDGMPPPASDKYVLCADNMGYMLLTRVLFDGLHGHVGERCKLVVKRCRKQQQGKVDPGGLGIISIIEVRTHMHCFRRPLPIPFPLSTPNHAPPTPHQTSHLSSNLRNKTTTPTTPSPQRRSHCPPPTTRASDRGPPTTKSPTARLRQIFLSHSDRISPCDSADNLLLVAASGGAHGKEERGDVEAD